MKQLCLLITAILFIGCKSADSDSFTYLNKQKFKIVQKQFLIDNDTISVNELRFYKISSARNTGQVFFDNFGQWNREIISNYNPDRTNALIWENKQLLDDDSLFSIICDGSESAVGYFSSIMIFDSSKKDCLNSRHPDHNRVINKITQMMKDRKPNMEFYKRTLKW